MITGKETFQHTRPCGAELFSSISVAVPSLLLVKHVSSVEMDLLGSTYGSSDLDFTPEAGKTDFLFFLPHVFHENYRISEMLSFITAKSTKYCLRFLSDISIKEITPKNSK